MNDLILTKMREGDWGAVVRLMREEREGVPSTARTGESVYRSQPMPFRERFETMRVTPQKIADSVIEENGRFAGLTVDREDHQALALIEDRGVPLPAGNIEVAMREDKRLQQFDYHDGVITGRFARRSSWTSPSFGRCRKRGCRGPGTPSKTRLN